MSPSPFGPHELLVSRIVQIFRNELDRQGCDCEVYAGLDWIVASDTVVRPDVMIVCGLQPTRHLERSPCLAVEVLSPSTAAKDLVQKRELYQHFGVSYYLLADPETKNFRALHLVDGVFHEIESSQTHSFELENGCTIALEPERLFR
jgi:Uma2 family endonuclease